LEQQGYQIRSVPNGKMLSLNQQDGGDWRMAIGEWSIGVASATNKRSPLTGLLQNGRDWRIVNGETAAIGK
jgi:hypothetical protein